MRVSLFWRTFLLLAALIIASLVATLLVQRVLEKAPPEQRLAWEVASVVNLTRSALVSAIGERRLFLLSELNREEGVRVFLLEGGDRIEELPAFGRLRSLQASLQTLLGPQTRVAARVNGEEGLWVSFDIDGDGYWLVLPRERLERQAGTSVWLIAAIALSLSLLGAVLISRLVNRPLAILSRAIDRLSRGLRPPRLREDLASELAQVNRRFNRLAIDLESLESDRAVALAGISHDIRTPLTRLRMEIELSGLDDTDKSSMSEEIERIDRIVGQFLEFGRSGQAVAASDVDVREIIDNVQSTYRAAIAGGELALSIDAAPGLLWRGAPLDLTRIVSNLVENALRHARPPDGSAVRVRITAARARDGLSLVIEDHGPGVPAEQFERLLRPFTRLDSERGVRAGGSGLGLAIVARLARRYGGECLLRQADPQGLRVELDLPDAARPSADAPATAARAAP